VSTGTWHVSQALLERYTLGRLDAAAEASIETHVTGCPFCRAEIARVMPLPDLGALWADVRDAIAQPPEPWLVRQLRRAGLPDADAVVLSASQSLRVPWALGVLAVVTAAVVLAQLSDRRADLVYLALAPLVPAVGVAATYDSTDPIRDITEATPLSKFRLLLLRTLVVLACGIPTTLFLGMAVTGWSTVAFAWLLPCLTLTLLALVLLRWWTAWVTSLVIASAWVAVLAVVGGRDGVDILVSPAAQVSCAVVSLAALSVLLSWFRPGSGREPAS
jgi:anti-sigma factor RsiW